MSQVTDDSTATPQISTFTAISNLIWGQPAQTSPANLDEPGQEAVADESPSKMEERKHPIKASIGAFKTSPMSSRVKKN